MVLLDEMSKLYGLPQFRPFREKPMSIEVSHGFRKISDICFLFPLGRVHSVEIVFSLYP
jgi:hypothetical protein